MSTNLIDAPDPRSDVIGVPRRPAARPKRSVRLRAYLLLEVTVAGAMAAVGITGLLVQLSSAQTNATKNARRVVAQQIASQTLNQVRTRAYDSIATENRTISVGGGTYVVGVVVTPNFDSVKIDSLKSINTDPDRDPGQPKIGTTLSMNYKDIAVAVTWRARDGDRTETVRSRAYRFTPITPP